ncbi:hypothetical protein D3C87_1847430 [compost metagenome]
MLKGTDRAGVWVQGPVAFRLTSLTMARSASFGVEREIAEAQLLPPLRSPGKAPAAVQAVLLRFRSAPVPARVLSESTASAPTARLPGPDSSQVISSPACEQTQGAAAET